MLRKILKNVHRPLIDFPALKKSRKPNTHLMGPVDFCGYTPDEVSPVFNVDKKNMQERFEKIILAEPNTEKLDTSEIDGDNQLDFVQFSRMIGFPDTITIRFMSAGEKHSTLVMYSRSHYGIRDFGVNRKRVQNWIHLLKKDLDNGS